MRVRPLPFVTAAMLDELQASAGDMADRLVEDVRERYAPDAITLRAVRQGGRDSVTGFVALSRGAVDDPAFHALRAGARDQFAGGRSLYDLIAFYRRGAVVMWRGALALTSFQSLSREQVVEFGEAVLNYVDQLSISAVEAFQQREAQLERIRRVNREHLVALLLAPEPASLEALDRAAENAQWQRPDQIRVAVLREPDTLDQRGTDRPPSRVLVASGAGRITMIVGDVEDADDWLLRTARALGLPPPLAVGPSVAVQHGHRSHRLAQALLDAAELIDAPGPVLRAEHHLMELLFTLDDDLAEMISITRLRPLLGLEDTARDRMLETLGAWLNHPRRPQSIAQELGIHVQTVHYRLERLRELLGESLDDPAERLDLAIALRLHAALGRAYK